MKRALNFGCGKDVVDKIHQWNPLDRFNHGLVEEDYEWDNIDMLDFGNIEHNLNEFPYPIKNNTYDYIFASFILEHLTDLNKVFNELIRISKPNALIYIKVPHWNSYSAYGGIEHIHSFHKMAFEDLYLDFPQMKLIELKDYPTIVGKFIFFRSFFSNYMSGLIRYINVKFEVVK